MNISDEYQSLRHELLDSFTREVNLATFGFTATAAIIGYGFTMQNPNPLVFLVPILILALILLQLNNSIYSILTISVYIRVFIEPKSNALQWETTIDALRAHLRKQKPFHSLTLFTELYYAVVSTVMGGICVFLAFYYDTSEQYYTITTAIAILWLIFCIIMLRRLRYANSGKYEQDVKRDIEEIYKQLKLT